jgi:hypothetical protein
MIQSTQKLILLLDNLTIDPSKRLYMCRGDDTAMYNNINNNSYYTTLEGMFNSLKLHNGKIDALLYATSLANDHN